MSDTKERPIILTTQEVKAVLAGNKTQHRVPVLTSEQLKEGFEWDFGADGDSAIFIKKIDDERQEVLLKPSPFGAIGDRLWVQEPTLAIEDVGWIGPVFVVSDAGRNAIDWGYGPYDDPAHIPACELTYNKPDDLSYEDSRILLEITDISIEHVQDITLGDSLKEARNGLMDFAADYWMVTHGEAAWFTNPWVWVIEFKVIDGVTDD